MNLCPRAVFEKREGNMRDQWRGIAIHAQHAKAAVAGEGDVPLVAFLSVDGIGVHGALSCRDLSFAQLAQMGGICNNRGVLRAGRNSPPAVCEALTP